MIRDHIAGLVAALEPGYAMTVSVDIMANYVQPPPGWTSADWVLEQIVGSAYEFGYHVNPSTRRVTFRREKKPLEDGRRTYVSPDRRHLFVQDGTYWIRRA